MLNPIKILVVIFIGNFGPNRPEGTEILQLVACVAALTRHSLQYITGKPNGLAEPVRFQLVPYRFHIKAELAGRFCLVVSGPFESSEYQLLFGIGSRDAQGKDDLRPAVRARVKDVSRQV